MKAMSQHIVPTFTPPRPRHTLQQALPLEAAERGQRIPESNRAKCVQLLRQLLETVVLRKPFKDGGNDER
jgi:hypothetical protein